MNALVRGFVRLMLAGMLACESRSLSPSRLAVAPAVSAAAVRPPAVIGEPEAVPVSVPERATVWRRLVSEHACEAAVFAVEGRTFVACGQELLVLEAGHLRSDPALVAGLELEVNGVGGRRLVRVAGRWPDALWAATVESWGGGNSNKLRFFRFRKDRWVKLGVSIELGGPESGVIFPWTDDGLGVVAARAFEPTRFLGFSAKPVRLPRLTKAVQSRVEREEYRCESRLIFPETWARLGPGDVMVFSGQLCGVPDKAAHTRWLGVEHLRAGEAAGVITLLPGPEATPASTSWEVVASAALSPTQVLVAARGIDGPAAPGAPGRRFTQLSRWDGASWRTELSPFTEITGLWALGDRFAITDEQGALWLEREAQWWPVDFRTDEPSAEAWSRGRIAELVAADGIWLLLHRQELQPGVVTSRLYRLDMPWAPRTQLQPTR